MGDREMVDLAAMALELHGHQDLDEALERVLEYSLSAVGSDHAGVVLLHGGKRLETAGVTHPVVEKADALQAEGDDGPGLTAIRERTSVLVRDTRREDRWPHWTAGVAQLGLRCVLSIRLGNSEANLGALTLYNEAPDGFDEDDEAVAQILARHASVALGRARHEESLWQAVDARKLVGQAQGMLMERFDLSADQAFAVLRRYSQDNNLKLRVVAQHLVTERTLPEYRPPT